MRNMILILNIQEENSFGYYLLTDHPELENSTGKYLIRRSDPLGLSKHVN